MEFVDYKRLYELSIVEKESLRKEIDDLDKKVNALTEHLKRYTNNVSNKQYYQKNKDKIIEQIKTYNKVHKKDPKKIKEYNKKAYEKRKLKNSIDNSIN